MNVTTEVIYTIQIGVLAIFIGPLLLCAYFARKSKNAMNGMYRSVMLIIISMIVLLMLLIVRRVDDLLGVLDSSAIVILSSAVVIVVGIAIVSLTLDMYRVFTNRGLYEMWQANRKAREDELEAMWEKSERIKSTWSS